LSCSVANDLLSVLSELCELRACIKDRSLTDPATIISSLLRLDTAVVNWGAERSSRWDHTTFFDSTNPDLIYDDSYAVYRAYWIAGTWNIQRAIRIITHEGILAHIDKVLSHSQSLTKATLDLLSSEHTRSLATISEMASDICTSVPYLLGHDKPYAKQLNDPVPAACGFFLVSELYLAGTTIGVPRELRLYVLGRLRYIGHKLGIQQSLLHAEILRERIESGNEEEMRGLLRPSGRVVSGSGGEDDWQGREAAGLWREVEEVDDDEGAACEIGGRLPGYIGDWEPKKFGTRADVAEVL
jgi:hypothetical protein